MSTLTIGLTGGIGSGKSLVSDHFQSLGVSIVDADVIAKEVTAPFQPAVYAIAERYGTEVLSGDGVLDRAKLRAIVFNSKTDKEWLEQLLHPIIFDCIDKELEKPSKHYKILSSPLLFETQQDKLVGYTVVVDIPISLQIERTCLRDNNNPELVEKIINNQITREQRLSRADYVIDNSGSQANTYNQIDTLHQQFLAMDKPKSK